MSATAETLQLVPETAWPPPSGRLPDFNPADLRELPVQEAQTGPETMETAPGSALPDKATSGPFVHTVDEEGQHIISDILGAVYGRGGTQEEALAEFYDMLDSHLTYLRANLDRLDPSYRGELAALQRLFGK